VLSLLTCPVRNPQVCKDSTKIAIEQLQGIMTQVRSIPLNLPGTLSALNLLFVSFLRVPLCRFQYLCGPVAAVSGVVVATARVISTLPPAGGSATSR